MLEVLYITPSIHLLPAVPIKCRCGRVVNSWLISKCKCTLRCIFTYNVYYFLIYRGLVKNEAILKFTISRQCGPCWAQWCTPSHTIWWCCCSNMCWHPNGQLNHFYTPWCAQWHHKSLHLCNTSNGGMGDMVPLSGSMACLTNFRITGQTN